MVNADAETGHVELVGGARGFIDYNSQQVPSRMRPPSDKQQI